MNKRGQVTVFMIIGFVILVIIALVLGLRHMGVGISPVNFLDSRMNAVKTNIQECVDTYALSALKDIGLQGGTLTPGKNRMYNNYRVSYFCTDVPLTEQCLNQMPSKANIQKELNKYLTQNVPGCADLEGLKNSLFFPNMQIGEFTILSQINDEDVSFEVSYPVTLTKGDSELKLPDLEQAVQIPLGHLMDVSYEVVDAEARTGVFFNLEYMLANRGAVEVYKDTPWPDKIYVLNERNSDYKLQFAIEGNDDTQEYV